MQRLGVADARPASRGVIYNDVEPTGLQTLVDGSIEVGRCRALGLDQRSVEIVVEECIRSTPAPISAHRCAPVHMDPIRVCWD